MSGVISVEGLRKSYRDVRAVEDVSFDVQAGEIFGILGPNGAGKTTTVECLQGLRRADGGQATVLGLDPAADARALRRRIGSQLQDSALPDRVKVWEALDLFGAGARHPVDPDVLLDQWGLAGKRRARFGDLSGGQRQRLFVALALVNRPEVVFLDEMTTGLDPQARRVAWDLIEAIRGQGATVVLVTHFMDEAERLCDRVAIFARGRVAAMDTPERLIAAHAGAVTLRFADPGGDLSWLSTVPQVASVARDDGRVEVSGDGGVIAYVGHALVERGMAPGDLRVEQSSLEDVYLSITGDHG